MEAWWSQCVVTESCKFNDQPAIIRGCFVVTFTRIADGLLFGVESSNHCQEHPYPGICKGCGVLASVASPAFPRCPTAL